MLLRPARPDDAERCALVHHLVWRATYSDLVPASFWATATLASRTASWEHWLSVETPPGHAPITVAEVDGVVIGHALAGPAADVAGFPPVHDVQLYQLYVLPEHHGAGVGQALLDAVVPGPAQLWVAEGSPRARRFYERNGFVPDGPRYTDDDFGGIVAIRMVR